MEIYIDKFNQIKRLSWQDDHGYHERYGTCENGWYIDLSYTPYDGLSLPIKVEAELYVKL